ncbi:MAG: ATP synthase subunit I [Sideroxydans sp.]|nr:ATP synthase subunit I [Sideroxydans sp.]NOT99650.1 ATP synthase subunit I [Sideroxydans sp.]
MTKAVGEKAEDCLTPPLNAAIIAALLKAEAQEKKQAQRITGLQFIFVVVASVCVFSFGATPQYAIAVLSGGGVSVLNGALMAWRMSRANQRSAHDAHLQLRLLYFYAAERFMAVVVSLILVMAVLKLPLAVLGGFVLGQTVLLTARLFLRIKTE